MAPKTRKKGRGETAIDVEVFPMPPPDGRKPPKGKDPAGRTGKKAKSGAEVKRDIEAFPPPMPPERSPRRKKGDAQVAIGNIDTIPMPWDRGKKPKKDEPAQVDVMPLPVPGRKTKKRAAIAGSVQPQWRTEVIPMPIPPGKKPPKKGTAKVMWKTEAIPMPIPPGRKPPRSKKK